MPELPDVELVARQLRRTLVGRTIRSVRVLSPSTIRSPSPAAFVRLLRGQRIRSIERRGKYLLIQLRGATLVAHLRMTGEFEVVPLRRPVHPHTRIIFNLGARDLRFVDQRRFGHMDLVPQDELARFAPLLKIGVEPLSPSLTFERFRALLGSRRGTVKSVLLHQDLMAGIGNLYADEILWQARLHPARQIPRLLPGEVSTLYRTIRSVLHRAVVGLSRSGRPVGRLLKLHESGSLCPRDGHPISIKRIAGRTTYFCTACQQ